MPDLLIELFSEEIPARMQAGAGADLKRLITGGLVEAGLTYASAGAFATPRRLALSVEGLSARSAAVSEERKGPRTDAPAAALEGFLRSTGLSREQLVAKDTGKGEAWFAVISKPGREAAGIVAEVLADTIRSFPWPKSMRWGAGELRWVRPLHSVLCILSDEGGAVTVPFEIDGIVAGDTTEGHRFHAPGRFSVSGFEDYRTKLMRAFVRLDAAERAELIWHEAATLAFAGGFEMVEDRALLAEVAGLVEWPVVLMGEIDAAFLSLPPEVLQTSMREHQKFFSVRNRKTGRIERFVTVANRETRDHGATVLAGNRKVLAARLSDARFFWENDLRVAKAGMTDWAGGLGSVTFHSKLGSQADRVARIAALAREIAPLVGADAEDAERAARIAKLDLRSSMVGEFPELQGAMGRYYALEAGEKASVADAARDHYAPLGPSDAVPREPVSMAVALADKIDTLTGFWAIDEKPTGSKDPFALRRAALGVIRLVVGNGVRCSTAPLLARGSAFHVKTILGRHGAGVLNDAGILELRSILQQEEPDKARYLSLAENAVWRGAEDAAAGKTERVGEAGRLMDAAAEISSKLSGLARIGEAEGDLLAFFHDRLKVHLRDQGIRHDVIDACLAMPGNDDLTLLVKRAGALAATMKTEDGANLIQGFKRANNILTQAEERDGVEYSWGADVKYAETDAERALFAALDRAEAEIAPAMAAEDFAAAMAAMAALRAPVDGFFESVQVNAESSVLRRNRLNLLSRIRRICLSVADLGRIEG